MAFRYRALHSCAMVTSDKNVGCATAFRNWLCLCGTEFHGGVRPSWRRTLYIQLQFIYESESVAAAEARDEQDGSR